MIPVRIREADVRPLDFPPLFSSVVEPPWCLIPSPMMGIEVHQQYTGLYTRLTHAFLSSLLHQPLAQHHLSRVRPILLRDLPLHTYTSGELDGKGPHYNNYISLENHQALSNQPHFQTTTRAPPSETATFFLTRNTAHHTLLITLHFGKDRNRQEKPCFI